jgi:glycosyltransferase involved in cell wall biosynthesis
MSGDAANIKFLGRVDHERLQELYRDAVATIVPSLCYETFGLIVAESFSARTPVIVYAQSSLAELVETHGGGLMYRTVEELRAAIDQLRSDPALRERLGRNGRTAYEAEFAEPAFLEHYVDLTRTLLTRKRNGAPAAEPSPPPDAKRIAGRLAFVA